MGKHITNFGQLINDNNSLLRFSQGDAAIVPPLQSDYTIAIVPDYVSQTNASEFQSLLVTYIDTKVFNNGFKRTQDKLGFATLDFSSSNSFGFKYIGVPYRDEKTNTTFTSLVHYYYDTQIFKRGTLRLKTVNWKLPTIYIINLKTSNVIYAMHNCMFSYPTFDVDPSKNDFVVYSTEVTFNKYQEFLYDNYFRVGNGEKKINIGRLSNQ